MSTDMQTGDSGIDQADALIAVKKVEDLKKNGVTIDEGTSYSHASTYGGKFRAFWPKHIGGLSLKIALMMFVLVIALIELVSYIF